MRFPFSFWKATSGGFDPATKPLTTWLRDFTGSSPWAGTASASSSGSNSATEHTSPPTAGTALNGHGTALFTGASSNQLTTTSNVDTMFSASAGTGIVLAKLTTVPTDTGDGSPYLVSTLMADGDTGNFAYGASSAGVRGGYWDGGAYVSKAVGGDPTGAYHALQFKWDGTNIKVRVDSGSWTSTLAGPAAIIGVPGVIGRSFIGSAWLDGLVAELITADSTLSDADCDNILSYFNSRYGLSL